MIKNKLLPFLLCSLFLWCSVAAASNFSVVTYNVWFDEPTAAERMPKLLDAIYKEKPDVVALQEVKPWFISYIKRDTRFSKYRVVMGKARGRRIQGEMLLLIRNKVQQQNYYDLPSRMGRGVLVVTSNINGIKICIATSHLESMLDDTDVRIRQLKYIFGKTKNCKNLLLVGDFNFGDGEPENKAFGSNYLDVWKVLKKGKPGYTWDIRRNKFAKANSFPSEGSRRLDKIYVKGNRLKPVNIKIIGNAPFKSASGKVLFASDHFGLSARFVTH